tara:strand:+ start:57 stop:719 length:663 start_codon:yes stop_codon:yes gene_type:complete
MIDQKNNNSIYGIFKNHKDEKLVYYPCPKNANSSAKLFFAKHIGIDEKILFLGDNMPRHLQDKSVYIKEKKIPLSNWLPSKQKFSKIVAEHKCCIVREPVKRFISAYKNRILYHKDKYFFEHSVDQVIEKLENNQFENRHFLPQTYFLGTDLHYYNHVGFIDNLLPFIEYINNFFGKKIDFPKIQKGGSELHLRLSKKQIDKVKKIYESDYIFLGSIYKD